MESLRRALSNEINFCVGTQVLLKFLLKESDYLFSTK